MERPKLQAKKRTVTGREVKKLRRGGILPANVYGKTVKSVALELPVKDFQKIYEQVGESGLVDLAIDGEIKPVLIHNVQLDPVMDTPLHADFHQVSLTEKTTAMISIELVGESPAVTQKMGILIQPLSEVEVEALPQDLPDHLMVNVSKLAVVGDSVTVGDIVVDKKVEILTNSEELVAKIDQLAAEEVAPVPTEEVVEGEAPAEGGEAKEGEEGAEAEVKAEEGKKKEEE
ncbi:MAG: 50S ribosomal protein L25 [bacterium]|nr:50S ribosomal protein L25 [bacterium]